MRTEQEIENGLKCCFGPTAKLIRVENEKIIFTRATIFGETYGDTTVEELQERAQNGPVSGLEHQLGFL